uniref:Protein krueppel n=1 Tax=Glossina brevipalpis TaxID=37001 RepID=A0A1A9WRD4_9MUSC
MLPLHPNITNSCLICQTIEEDNDYEALFTVNKEVAGNEYVLTVTGKMYEELIGLEIPLEMRNIYPQFLCNSCDLQMKLFKKLQLKARRTLQLLKEMYDAEEMMKENLYSECCSVEYSAEDNAENTLLDMKSQEEEEQEGEKEDQDIGEENVNLMRGETLSQHIEMLNDTQEVETNDYVTDIEEIISESDQLPAGINRPGNEIEGYISDYGENSMGGIQYVEGQEQSESNQEMFIDASASKRRTREKSKDLNCLACGIQFEKATEYKYHIRSMHDEKYPCGQCSKLFNSTKSLKLHMNLHNGFLPYQCEICQRSFNQKVHYQIHLNRHNNIRNFKCDECDKSFFSKADLKIHGRSHTGIRPYVCNICKKDYMLSEHLRTHLYTHTDQKFECKFCKQNFRTPSTLRLHQRTFHLMEKRFKCQYCGKLFRRKHHLLYHTKKIHADYNDLEVIDESELDRGPLLETDNDVSAADLYMEHSDIISSITTDCDAYMAFPPVRVPP